MVSGVTALSDTGVPLLSNLFGGEDMPGEPARKFGGKLGDKLGGKLLVLSWLGKIDSCGVSLATLR